MNNTSCFFILAFKNLPNKENIEKELFEKEQKHIGNLRKEEILNLIKSQEQKSKIKDIFRIADLYTKNKQLKKEAYKLLGNPFIFKNKKRRLIAIEIINIYLNKRAFVKAEKFIEKMHNEQRYFFMYLKVKKNTPLEQLFRIQNSFFKTPYIEI